MEWIMNLEDVSEAVLLESDGVDVQQEEDSDEGNSLAEVPQDLDDIDEEEDPPAAEFPAEVGEEQTEETEAEKED